MMSQMRMINDQLILEEEYDENYIPTEEGICEFTVSISVSLSFLHFLFHIYTTVNFLLKNPIGFNLSLKISKIS